MLAGWERADWFAPHGVEPVHRYSWGRANWFPYQKDEHLAVREAVGMYDLTSMHNYLVQGPDAEAVLQTNLRQRRGRARRDGGLHPAAERARRVRVRPDRHALRGGLLFHRDRARNRGPGLRLHPSPHPGERARHHHRRHPRATPCWRSWGRMPGTSCPSSPMRTCPTRPFRSGPPGRSIWAMPGRGRCG